MAKSKTRKQQRHQRRFGNKASSSANLNSFTSSNSYEASGKQEVTCSHHRTDPDPLPSVWSVVVSGWPSGLLISLLAMFIHFYHNGCDGFPFSGLLFFRDVHLGDGEEDLPWHTNVDDSNEVVTVGPECRLVMAESTIPDGGFGTFSVKTIEVNETLFSGESVIQVPNLRQNNYEGISYLLHRYIWEADTTGGINEGNIVYSVVPGIGMILNGHPELYNSDWRRPGIVHHGGIIRGMPGAGSSTHYHDVRSFSTRKISPGDELFVDYGVNWKNKISDDFLNVRQRRSTGWLMRNGICLDRIRSGWSKMPGLGRGAFAKHAIQSGQVISPLPMVVIARSSLDMIDDDGGGDTGEGLNDKQLLINYCFGHPLSSVLLFPYSPTVNLINHGNGTNAVNAELRWMTRRSGMPDQDRFHELSASDILSMKQPGIMLELVAKRDIRPDEEIFIDYGEAWTKAWSTHTNTFERRKRIHVEKEPKYWINYTYQFDMNRDSVSHAKIRTMEEQQAMPYPPNIDTSCYYHYMDSFQKTPTKSEVINGIQTHYTYWASKGENLIPNSLHRCSVIERDDDKNLYTVVMFVAPTSDPTQIHALQRERHVVRAVPRAVIIFTDKRHSTDQHLAVAFRHEIGLPTGLFPINWLDLLYDDG